MPDTRLRARLESVLPAGPAFAQLRYSFLGLMLVVGLGVAGYVWIADFPPFDALYQTVLTVTTIGFQEVNPMGQGGRIFTIFLSIVGVGAVLFVFGSAAALIFEGDLKRDLGAWRMSKNIDALQDHVIVCGAGRVGREVASELAARRSDFVVIDASPAALAVCEKANWLTVEGDASSVDVLQRAGVARAKGLVVATHSDAQNTFILLTARGLNPDLYIVARSADPESEANLFQAGADRVISPTTIAGRRMALATLHPSVVDFAETVLRGGGSVGDGVNQEERLLLAQIDIMPGAPWDGMTVAQAFADHRVRVLGIRSADGELTVAPSRAFPLSQGIALMIYGRSDEIEELSAYAAPAQT